MSPEHEICRVPRKAWRLPFHAEREEVAGVRRVLSLHLRMWGLAHVNEEATLCVSELVTNVVKHVGEGAPATLSVFLNGTALRMEVLDYCADRLPHEPRQETEAECGRGLLIVEGLARQWGVLVAEDHKRVWCEISTGLTSPEGHRRSTRVDRAEELLLSYACAHSMTCHDLADVREAASTLVGDLMLWSQAHGHDPYRLMEAAYEQAGGY